MSVIFPLCADCFARTGLSEAVPLAVSNSCAGCDDGETKADMLTAVSTKKLIGLMCEAAQKGGHRG